MRFFDLHCDTIYEITKKNGDIFKNDLSVSLEKTKNFKSYIGCFAVWIPDSLRGQSAFDFFEKCQKTLHAQAKKNENIVKICKYGADRIGKRWRYWTTACTAKGIHHALKRNKLHVHWCGLTGTCCTGGKHNKKKQCVHLTYFLHICFLFYKPKDF